jgi:imidazolonepropionase-like amidohydrolase
VVALAHVTVVDVKSGKRLPDRTIVFARGRITRIPQTVGFVPPSGARRIDGEGGFAIPGLWDMHVHIFNQVSRRPANTWYFPLFVANGVLAVRDMWTKPENMEAVRSWRAEVGSGKLIAPRVVAVGRVLDGPNPVWPNTDTVTTPEQARRMVDETKAAGLDFVKVYSKLSRPVYFAIVSEANRVGISFAGHVPVAVDASEASAAGQRSIEHLTGIFESSSRRSKELLAIPYDSWTNADDSLMWSTFDDARCARLCRILAAHRTAQVPTLCLHHELTAAEVDGNDPRQRYVPATELETWRPFLARRNPSKAAIRERHRQARQHVVGMMRRAGVPIMAGTDLGNPYLYPGFSLHDELRLLVECGLSPLEALRAATLTPARFLAMDDSLGTIEPGKLADFVLLDADPLADIGNVTRIRAVVLNGRVLPRSELDDLLKAAAEAGRR